MAICAALLLSACSLAQTLLGVPASEINTANKALAASAVQIRITAELAKDLYIGGVINSDQRDDVADALERAIDVIEVAQQSVEQNGDPSQAASAIEAASIALSIAMQILTSNAPELEPVLYERIQRGSDHSRSIKRHSCIVPGFRTGQALGAC